MQDQGMRCQFVHYSEIFSCQDVDVHYNLPAKK